MEDTSCSSFSSWTNTRRVSDAYLSEKDEKTAEAKWIAKQNCPTMSRDARLNSIKFDIHAKKVSVKPLQKTTRKCKTFL